MLQLNRRNKSRLISSALCLLSALLFNSAVEGQTPQAAASKSIELVLDASASMWNRLPDGRYRIVAAKEVLKNFISALPNNPNLNVGLRIYGSKIHFSQDGACTDSQIFIPVKGIDRGKMTAEVDRAKAIGATPLSDSLLQAVNDFPAEGDKLIVVFTDGEESCGKNFEDAVRQLREKNINVSLKIVGIDLSAEAVARIKKVAEIENVQSLSALAQALDKAVKSTVSAAPAEVSATIRLKREGQAVGGAHVSLVSSTTGKSAALADAGSGSHRGQFLPGSYQAVVEAGGERYSFDGLSLSPGAANTIDLELPRQAKVVLEVSSAETFTAGKPVTVRFSEAPGTGEQWVAIAEGSAPSGDYFERMSAAGTSGEVQLPTPDEPLQLEARFFVSSGGSFRLAGRSAPFSTKRIEASLTAPAEAKAGSQVNVSWEGPNAERDYIAIVVPGSPDGTYRTHQPTADGKNLQLQAPMTAGDYEIRYVAGRSSRVLAKRPIKITPVTASLDAQNEVPAGSIVRVGWQGPNYERDYIAVTKPSENENSQHDYAYASEGPQVELKVPDTAGDYELRYITGFERKIIGRRPLKVTAVSATLSAPEEVGAGSPIAVAWTGPKNEHDFISIAKLGTAGNDSIHYDYLNQAGEPVKLRAPDTVGDYELRYVTGQERKILARRAVRVAAAAATVSGPDQIDAGSPIQVSYTGPKNEHDFISIAKLGTAGTDSIRYDYVNEEGTAVKLTAPDTAGDYELRYVTGQERKILARRPIRVVAASATLSAPDEIGAGSPIQITYTGPRNEHDFISIAKLGTNGSDSLSYDYVNDEGTPVELKAPDAEGDYEVRYVTGQERKILARRPLRVSATTAALSAAEEASAGNTVEISWTGPDNENDFIAVAKPQAAGSQSEAYTYAKTGNPLSVRLPDEPGDYELRYVTGQSRKILTRRPIKASAPQVSITVSEKAFAGAKLEVTWEGPNNQNDLIGFAVAEAADNSVKSYEYTKNGNPLSIPVPPAPGSYEIRYLTGQRKKVIGRKSIEVVAVKAEISAPAEVKASSQFEVSWQGPGRPTDFLTIVRKGDSNRAVGATYLVNRGSSFQLSAPDRPGDYEVRYMLGDSRVAAGRTAVKVLP